MPIEPSAERERKNHFDNSPVNVNALHSLTNVVFAFFFFFVSNDGNDICLGTRLDAENFSFHVHSSTFGKQFSRKSVRWFENRSSSIRTFPATSVQLSNQLLHNTSGRSAEVNVCRNWFYFKKMRNDQTKFSGRAEWQRSMALTICTAESRRTRPKICSGCWSL